MQHIVFSDNDEDANYQIAILTKSNALRYKPLKEHYVNYIQKEIKQPIIAFDIEYDTYKKVSAKTADAYLADLLPILKELDTQYIVVTDSTYFKRLTKQKKAEVFYGYCLPCTVAGYEHMRVVLCPSYTTLFYKPEVVDQIKLSLDCLIETIQGVHVELGSDIIHFEAYPSTVEDVRNWLTKLHTYPKLTMDIEAYSLKFHEAGVGTISFAWNQHEGIAFSIDYGSETEAAKKKRKLLKEFFEEYQGEKYWHNAGYDVTVLIYQLWMKGFRDQVGLLEGLDCMCENMHDTRIIAYLATNSCSGNELGLKDLSHAYAGNYALNDINDITKIPVQELLKYNLVDSLNTFYVLNKYWDVMVQDQQLDIYNNLFRPALKNIIQMQLTGLPLDMERTKEVNEILLKEREGYLDIIRNKPIIVQVTQQLRQDACDKKNQKLKTKVVHIEDFDNEFNPNSALQLQLLLYDFMGLPIIEYTKAKAPATGAKVLDSLIHHCKTEEHKELVQALIDYSKIDKILTSFMPAFLAAPQAEDGWHYLYGFFNLGGTISGRLSSSNP